MSVGSTGGPDMFSQIVICLFCIAIILWICSSTMYYQIPGEFHLIAGKPDIYIAVFTTIQNITPSKIQNDNTIQRKKAISNISSNLWNSPKMLLHAWSWHQLRIPASTSVHQPQCNSLTPQCISIHASASEHQHLCINICASTSEHQLRIRASTSVHQHLCISLSALTFVH